MNNFENKNKLWIKIAAISLITMIVAAIIMNVFQLKVTIGYTEHPIKNIFANIVYNGFVLAALALFISSGILVTKLVIKIIIEIIKW